VTLSRDASDRRRLEAQVLVLQCAIAVFYCVGAYAGLFGVEGAARTASVAWIFAYHVVHTWYVLRFRSAGRPVAWVELATPLADVSCITAAWVAIGDPTSSLWAVYLYALVGYSRRIHGTAYTLVAGFILVNVVGGKVFMSAQEGLTPVDANLVINVVILTCMALLAAAIGTAWRRAEAQARVLAETDPLTGIANRRTFLEQLEALAARPDSAFSILMLDLDDFKRLNDEHGHLAGDLVLSNVADALTANLREHDRLARYGGEEFVVVLPGADTTAAHVTAERLRLAVQETTPSTISVGCAARRPAEPAESVIRRADALLLAAKRTGKNAVRTDAQLRRSA
jgi:diguanylate cyclase (GGDEF)-like protein